LLDELERLGITDYVATINRDGTSKPEYLQRIENASTIMELVKKHPDVDCVVAGWDQQLSTLKIAVAAMYIRLNPKVKLITCSMDSTGVFGAVEGEQVYAVGNGVIARAICNAVDRGDHAYIDVGKPSCIMLEHLKKPEKDGGYGIDSRNSVMIGDTLETDMELARKGGMKCVLVFSGVTKRDDWNRLPLERRSHVTWAVSTFAQMCR
jgi:4-nitrophenyl phosphatase